ncbi:MAG: hypothetical protein U0744_11685 [Gemmataceae bacterium]
MFRFAVFFVGFGGHRRCDGVGLRRGKKGPGEKKGFQLGTVLPPHIQQELDLTDAQTQKIKALEREVRSKLEGILTPEQIQKIREIKGPPRKEGGPDGKGPEGKGPDGKGDKKGKPPMPQRNPDGEQSKLEWDGGGIQWYATWKQGLAEAQRSNRPILLVSAAPHCSGISGVW